MKRSQKNFITFFTVFVVGAGALSLSNATGSAMIQQGFLPHAYCFKWDQFLLGLHLISDFLIGLAYFAIPLALIYFIRKRQDIPFNWMFVLFGVFITMCGLGHFMEMATLFSPQYYLTGSIKAITAIVSVMTAVVLIKIMPRLLTIPSTDMLQKAHEDLQQQVKEKDHLVAQLNKLMAELQSSYNEVEARAEQRSTEIIKHKEDEQVRKDRFLAVLSHELRNPLGPIKNAVGVLNFHKHKDCTVSKMSAIIDRQVGHLARLLDDLLDVTRITQNKIHMRIERVNVTSIISSVIESCKDASDAAKHNLSVKLPHTTVYVDVDPTRLEQVITNLVTNAIKYTPAGGGGRITVSVKAEPHDVVISVKDNGIGVAREHKDKLFELFNQVEGSQSSGGLGIGLAVAKGLAELQGGTIWVESEGRGQGSEFFVRLPRAIEPSKIITKTIDLSAAQKSLKILIADDNIDAVQSLGLMLKMMGHEVNIANDGAEAIAAADLFRPHVCILDIGMPKYSGYDVAGHIRNQPWGQIVYLIALTGWGQEQDKKHAIECGFDKHITKPLDVGVIQHILNGINTTIFDISVIEGT